jgi:hypothetical protein
MFRTGFSAGFVFLALTAAALGEQRAPGGGGYTLKPLVTPQQMAPPQASPAPYAMNYSEDVARSLKVQDGGLPLLPRQDTNPYAPSVTFYGSMIRLRWHP